MTEAPDEEAAWASLERELEAWAAAGRTATVWWRDDDAHRPAGALDRLLAIAAALDVPIALAVVPAWLEPGLDQMVSAHRRASVFQHGFAHINHARRAGEKGACEIGLHRGRQAIRDELKKGRAILEDALGDDFVPVLTPPWNRIDRDVLADLPDLGFSGLSTYAARGAAAPADGLRVNNCHCDPVDWKSASTFRGTARTLKQLVDHLRDRREGRADAAEATGFLTHHLDMDEATWRFTDRLIGLLSRHPAVRWPEPGELFAP